MPPKKKEDAKNAKETRDVGTDPPEPLEFNPFDIDGRKLIEDWNWMPPLACEALRMLKTQNTTGTLKVIKDKVIKKMEQLIRWMNDFTESLNKARTIQGWQRAQPARRASRAGQDKPSRAKDFKLVSQASRGVRSLARLAIFCNIYFGLNSI